MRDIRVVLGRPRIAAAPVLPPITQFVSRNASAMQDFSTSTSVRAGAAEFPGASRVNSVSGDRNSGPAETTIARSTTF